MIIHAATTVAALTLRKVSLSNLYLTTVPILHSLVPVFQLNMVPISTLSFALWKIEPTYSQNLLLNQAEKIQKPFKQISTKRDDNNKRKRILLTSSRKVVVKCQHAGFETTLRKKGYIKNLNEKL